MQVADYCGYLVAGQRIHVGIAHAGSTLTVEAADTTFRVHDGDDQLVTEVARTTVKPVARFKARKPEPARRGHDDTAFGPPIGEAAVL